MTARTNISLPRFLPGGRAIIGAALCTAAVAITGIAYAKSTEQPTIAVLIAKSPIEVGQTLSADDVRSTRVAKDPSLLRNSVLSIADIQGTIALGPIAPGDLIQRSSLLRKEGGAGSREVSIAVESSAAAGGRIRSSDRVTIVATGTINGEPETEVIASNVLVLHVDRGTTGMAAGTSPLVVTLSADSETDPIRIVHAQATGKIALIRTTGVS